MLMFQVNMLYRQQLSNHTQRNIVLSYPLSVCCSVNSLSICGFSIPTSFYFFFKCCHCYTIGWYCFSQFDAVSLIHFILYAYKYKFFECCMSKTAISYGVVCVCMLASNLVMVYHHCRCHPCNCYISPSYIKRNKSNRTAEI